MRSLSHGNIIKIYEVYVDSKNLSIVMEYCSEGELIDKINDSLRIPETEAVIYFRQIAAAIKHCHDNGIAHKDIKPENLLLYKDKIIKLIDFGNAERFNDTGRMSKLVGTPSYMAPEVICKDYDAKCDI